MCSWVRGWRPGFGLDERSGHARRNVPARGNNDHHGWNPVDLRSSSAPGGDQKTRVGRFAGLTLQRGQRWNELVVTVYSSASSHPFPARNHPMEDLVPKKTVGVVSDITPVALARAAHAVRVTSCARDGGAHAPTAIYDVPHRDDLLLGA